MVLKLPDDMVLDLDLTPVDEFGNPTTQPVDGVPIWSTSDTAIATVTASADGLSAVVRETGVLGPYQVAATLGELHGLLDMEAVAGAARAFKIQAGAPRPA